MHPNVEIQEILPFVHYDIKDPLLFHAHHRYINATSPLLHDALSERVVQNAGAPHYSIKGDTLHLKLRQCLCFC